VGGRTVGGRTVGGRTVGGRTVGGRAVGGRTVGGRAAPVRSPGRPLVCWPAGDRGELTAIACQLAPVTARRGRRL